MKVRILVILLGVIVTSIYLAPIVLLLHLVNCSGNGKDLGQCLQIQDLIDKTVQSAVTTATDSLENDGINVPKLIGETIAIRQAIEKFDLDATNKELVDIKKILGDINTTLESIETRLANVLTTTPSTGTSIGLPPTSARLPYESIGAFTISTDKPN